MILTAVLAGLSMALIGFITPAMLNMNAVRNALEKGVGAGIMYSIGAALINATQALIAFSFLKYFDANPEVIEWLKRGGAFVLFGLSYFFYTKSKKAVGVKDSSRSLHPFAEGMLLSTLNMLALPYYFAASFALDSAGTLDIVSPINYYMTGGVFLGGLIMFSGYSVMADRVAKRIEWISKNINLLLAVLFLALGLLVSGNVIYTLLG